VKIEGWIFGTIAIWFSLMAPVYWFLSREPAGTTAFTLSAGLGWLIAFYVLYTGRRIDPRPEDRKQGEIAEGAGEVGFFSPHSWWPLPVSFSVAVVSLGLVFGWWLFFIGLFGLMMALIGLVFEYYRGAHAH
jgi:hypothetical protein